jgi:hypothetical protein
MGEPASVVSPPEWTERSHPVTKAQLIAALLALTDVPDDEEIYIAVEPHFWVGISPTFDRSEGLRKSLDDPQFNAVALVPCDGKGNLYARAGTNA